MHESIATSSGSDTDKPKTFAVNTRELTLFLRQVLAILIPLAALVFQSIFWPAIQPYVWFLFYPAVFFSSWVGGLSGGLVATVLSTTLVWWFFIPTVHSAAQDPKTLISVAVFMGMGVLFSISHGRLRKANRQAAEALAAERNANDQLQDANDKISALYKKTRELDDLKTQFFANVSHELRTPLTLILGPIGKRLSAGGLTDEERQELELVDRNARLLYRHVSDLLDVAKLEAGQMVMSYADVDLSQLVRFTASHFEVLAVEKRVHYTVEAPETLHAEVDVEKCQRILLNLLSNAFKFTPDGGSVLLSLFSEGSRAVFQVRDSGPGVPTDKHEAIFERFRQVEGGADRPFGGTGLGLAIVKEFAELHGGTVDIADAPDGGALFTVSLSVQAPEGAEVRTSAVTLDQEIDRQALDEFRGPRATAFSGMAPVDAPLVLVVEDNPDMNAYVSDALGAHYRVATAFDGREGLAKALEMRPDLILTDLMMPGMSGDQMVLALRGHREMTDVPVVILSAKADEELRAKLLREGAQDYINKPFSVEELLARVGGLVAERRRSQEALRKSEELFRTTLESMMEGCQIISRDWKYLYVNETAAEQGRRAQEEYLGRGMLECFPDFDKTAIYPVLKKCMEERVPHRMENEFTYPDGSKAWFELSIQPIPEGIFILSIEITERKKAEAEVLRLNAELEQRVEERTAELTAANQELDAFAYAVSHDLRAPLRAMTGFSQALVEDHGNQLEGDARLYLDQITVASRHMGQLIDGLLTLSRNTRGMLCRDRVDLSALSERILTEFAGAEPERRMSRQIEPGLTATGDIHMIEVIMRNLLRNAWKYTADRTAPEIKVYGEQNGGERRFCVADNGVGFDMRHADRLYQPFQRLHRQDEFPGIGIGLATVQRIVHRHGGTIHAAAALDKGATFCFSLSGAEHDEGEKP